MAEKRMFGRSIIEKDSFLDLPLTTKAIYFLLGMEADDEGFVSPKRVTRLYGGNDDDVKVLIGKKFLIPFESGVVVITDWYENNYLDKSRIKPTLYQEEKKLLALTDGKKYEFNKCLTNVKPEENRIEENSIVEKKISCGEFKNVHLLTEEKEKLVERYGSSAIKNLIEELSSYQAASGKKYKSHYATLLNWAKRKGIEVQRVETRPEETQLTEEQVAKNMERLAKMRTDLVKVFKK